MFIDPYKLNTYKKKQKKTAQCCPIFKIQYFNGSDLHQD